MAGRKNTETPEARPAASEAPGTRQGRRAHDANGNVRPADGRWDLHDPKDESKYVTGKGE